MQFGSVPFNPLIAANAATAAGEGQKELNRRNHEKAKLNRALFFAAKTLEEELQQTPKADKGFMA